MKHINGESDNHSLFVIPGNFAQTDSMLQTQDRQRFRSREDSYENYHRKVHM